jgi:hypothetical protein
MEEMLATQDTGIEESFDIESVRFLMVDGRYYREEKDSLNYPLDVDGHLNDQEELTSMLGVEQKSWLKSKISSWTDVCIICTGSTLTGRSETWEQHNDLEWFENQNFKKTIVLSGDIHKIASQQHKELGGLWELTASGAARPKRGGASGNYGVINIDDEGIKAFLYDKDGLGQLKNINFDPIP